LFHLRIALGLAAAEKIYPFFCHSKNLRLNTILHLNNHQIQGLWPIPLHIRPVTCSGKIEPNTILA
jgi:hypothetical protein